MRKFNFYVSNIRNGRGKCASWARDFVVFVESAAHSWHKSLMAVDTSSN